jgi:uncharacterized protein (DUF427 family)
MALAATLALCPSLSRSVVQSAITPALKAAKWTIVDVADCDVSAAAAARHRDASDLLALDAGRDDGVAEQSLRDAEPLDRAADPFGERLASGRQHRQPSDQPSQRLAHAATTVLPFCYPISMLAENGRPFESVWDYPRPPRVEPLERHVRIELAGEVIAESDRAVRVLETAGAPTIYLPREDVRTDKLRPARGTTECEWKGTASYFDAIAGQKVRPRAAWTYREPNRGFETLRDRIAFYASRVDGAYLDDERVEPQPGDFYGGWVSAEIEGTIKGEPGSEGW